MRNLISLATPDAESSDDNNELHVWEVVVRLMECEGIHNENWGQTGHDHKATMFMRCKVGLLDTNGDSGFQHMPRRQYHCKLH